MGDLRNRCNAWLRSRPADCPARAEVERTLKRLTGPLRVAVTSPVAALEVPLSGAVRVRCAWPLTCPSIDVGILVTPQVTGRMRARIAAGPCPIYSCATVAEVQAIVDAVDVRAVRERLLAVQLAHVARRFPGAGVPSSPRPLTAAAPRPRVCVVGRNTVSVLEELRCACDVVEGPDKAADVCVAVAGPGGWLPGDAEILARSFAAVGRLVVTAPPPPGLDPLVVTARGGLTETVFRACRRPPAAPLPTVQASHASLAVRTLHPRRRVWQEQLLLSVVVAVGLSRVLPVLLAAAVAGALFVLRRRARRELPGRAWVENLVRG
ncbi:hypothetical protein HMPREF1219_01608 [Corynebacterium pyruviciproducens ATCC BAA-1742]|uniref:Uncharacterized protein n=1 Tax=Corynebacterium pyruviciproducens ATCC BAA-1742 TaxID=1125779 RepID=S2ZEI9_9CORY|nr:hypothetical protein [Corynebacterium pyruviciproducens]EPD68427.1 hypothetical protein HMPREF1219_01608 [Corynebacterium pyruviciproducens ATCC BAA-1742]